MVSNAPHNPSDVEVEEPTQPYSRAEINRLRQAAEFSTPAPREQRLDDADEDAGDPGMDGWFELGGRWLRVCAQSFEQFGFSGAPPGMIGAVDASLVSGTIDREGSASELEPKGSQPFSRRHKWKLGGLVAAALALALTAWVFARIAAEPVQPMTRDAEQVSADVPSEPTKVPIEPPTIAGPEPDEVPRPEPDEIPAPAPDEIHSHEEPPKNPKARKDFGACVEHRKSATDAKDGGDWVQLLELAQRHRSCWSRVSANALQMEALFELGRYPECVQLGAQGGSKKEIQKWLNACQSNL
jgi:HAMP domain-containing protein